MNRLRTALAATLLAQPLAAAAQPPTPAPAAPPPWQVDWGQYYCSLIRLPAPDRRFAAAFLTIPSDDRTMLMLVPEGRRADWPRGVDSLVLLPSGRRFETHSFEQWRGERRVLALPGLPYEMRGALEGQSIVELRAGSAVRLRIPVDQARAAIAAHRRCTADISRQWRLDEAALAALRERPQTTNFLGYNSGDYPAAALRSATQGRVIIRITVTAEGRGTDCEVVATSGSPAIDATSCRVAMSRGRFTPGRDAAGRPVTIASVFTVTWRLPGR